MRLHAKGWSVAAPLVLIAAAVGAHAQGAPIPVKPGLWEMQVSAKSAVALPPEAEARIAALPAAQQAQVRSMMGGGIGGGAPTVTTKQVCMTGQSSMDSMLNRAQQSAGMQCTFSNRVQTASGASFDMACTGATGSATGHTQFKLIDADHVSSSSHMTMTGSSQGHTATSTVDSTSTAKFVSAECGDVKPFTPAAGH